MQSNFKVENKPKWIKCAECEQTFLVDDDLTHMNNCKKDVWVKALLLLYKNGYFKEEN